MSKPPISLQKAREMGREEKEQLLGAIEQEAHDNEVVYWGCSQSILIALQRHLKLGDSEAFKGAFKAASAFPGGIAGMRETCAALIGGVLAVGLAYGRTNFEEGKVAQEQPDYLETKVRARRFCDQFKERFGSVSCSDIRVSIRGADYKEYTRYNTFEAFKDHAWCGNVSGPAARIAAEIILQPTELFADEINATLEDLSQARKQQKEAELE